MWKWFKRGFLVLVTALFVSGIYGYLTTMNDRAPYEMIAVEGDRALHVLCEGPETAPLVLYDAGAFGIYADGWWIKEELKSDVRVCLFDRAGMGWSDPVPDGVAPSAKWHVDDMRRLIDTLGAERPVYLIGHSMAGLRLHVYANAYPDEIAGLIFIDAARPQSFDLENKPPRWLKLAGPAMRIGEVLARLGIPRALSPLFGDPLDLPEQQARDKTRTLSVGSHYDASRRELLSATADASYYTARNAEAVPVSVFAASESGGRNAVTAREAEKAAGFGRLHPLPEENHVSLLARPTAKKVADDLRAMINFVTTNAQDDPR